MRALATLLAAIMSSTLLRCRVSRLARGRRRQRRLAGTAAQDHSAAARLVQPGDVITVHEGVYRERVNPPRGGASDRQARSSTRPPRAKRSSSPVGNRARLGGVPDDTWR